MTSTREHAAIYIALATLANAGYTIYSGQGDFDRVQALAAAEVVGGFILAWLVRRGVVSQAHFETAVRVAAGVIATRDAKVNADVTRAVTQPATPDPPDAEPAKSANEAEARRAVTRAKGAGRGAAVLLALILGADTAHGQSFLDGIENLGRQAADELIDRGQDAADRGAQAARERLGVAGEQEPAPGVAAVSQTPQPPPIGRFDDGGVDVMSWAIPAAAFFLGTGVVFMFARGQAMGALPPWVQQIASEGFALVTILGAFLLAAYWAQHYEFMEFYAVDHDAEGLSGVFNQRHMWAKSVADFTLALLLFVSQDRLIGRGCLHSEAMANKPLPGREAVFTPLQPTERMGILIADALKLSAACFVVATGMGF